MHAPTGPITGRSCRCMSTCIYQRQTIGWPMTIDQCTMTQDSIECYAVSQKTVQNCFYQNFVKFPPIWIIFGRKMAKRLKLCEMHSFSTSPNSRYHTTMLNADVRNCYTTLKVVICSKLTNDINSTSKVKCGLFTRIISSYNSSVQNCQNLCSEWAPRVVKRLDDDVTENVKLHCNFTFSVASSHLRFHGNMLLYRVEGVKMRCYFLLFSG